MTGTTDRGSLTLDAMFAWLEGMVPEGYKSEIVGGHIFLTPQRDTHWDITIGILEQLRPRYPLQRLLSDVRMDYPGHLNGFASDVVALAEGPGRRAEFVAEVISRETSGNDYGPKKDAYAAAGVPVYLIVDPYTGVWHLHTLPHRGAYHGYVRFGFGTVIDLTGTDVGLVIGTGGFPRYVTGASAS